MKKLVYLVLVFAIISCKEEKTKPTITEPIEVEAAVETNNDDFFTLRINAAVEYDDKIILYYLEEDQKNITNENSVELFVSGGVSPQDLLFRLQENVLPTKLILKYGNEQKQQKIQFIEAEISYEGEKIEMDAYKFYQFFIPNEFIVYDQNNHIATSREKNGQYNPIFFSRKVLEDKLDYTFY